jgi:hypothetical protein
MVLGGMLTGPMCSQCSSPQTPSPGSPAMTSLTELHKVWIHPAPTLPACPLTTRPLAASNIAADAGRETARFLSVGWVLGTASGM